MKKVFLSNSGTETSIAFYSFWRWKSTDRLKKEKMKEIIFYILSLSIYAFNISPIYGSMKAQKSINQ
jgi:hypothetical protein